MVTIPIEAEVSAEQLLRAVEQLPSREFAAFVAQLLALRAQRDAPHVSQQETVLLVQINEGPSVDARQRFDELVVKRQSENITSEELTELTGITDQIEQQDAQRVAAIAALAQLRRTTLTDLMDSLGLLPPDYA